MIVIEKQPKRVEVTVYAEFTLADYQEFETAVNYAIQFEGPVDLFFDLREMADFTLDVAWEDIVFARAHANDFSRIAVLTHLSLIHIFLVITCRNCGPLRCLRFCRVGTSDSRSWPSIGPM